MCSSRVVVLRLLTNTARFTHLIDAAPGSAPRPCGVVARQESRPAKIRGGAPVKTPYAGRTRPLGGYLPWGRCGRRNTLGVHPSESMTTFTTGADVTDVTATDAPATAAASTDSLTVRDNRTGQSYDLAITDNTIKAADLGQIRLDEETPAWRPTTPVSSTPPRVAVPSPTSTARRASWNTAATRSSSSPRSPTSSRSPTCSSTAPSPARPSTTPGCTRSPTTRSSTRT